MYQPNTTNRTHCPGRMFGLRCTMCRVQFGSCLLKRNPSHIFCNSVALLGRCTRQECKASTRLVVTHLGNNRLGTAYTHLFDRRRQCTFLVGTLGILYRPSQTDQPNTTNRRRCHSRMFGHCCTMCKAWFGLSLLKNCSKRTFDIRFVQFGW